MNSEKKIIAYCHTTYSRVIPTNTPSPYNILEGNWYTIYSETLNYYTILHSTTNSLSLFYKENSNKYLLFSKYFYTEKEYNRIKSLNELIND